MFGGKINKPVVYTEYVNMRPFLSEPQVFLPPLSACLSSVIILTTPPLRTLPRIILFHPSLSLSLTFPLPTLSSLSLLFLSPPSPPPPLSLYLTKGPSEWYQLYGVLVHSGFSSHSGHYYCYIRNSTGVWYCMNDAQVHVHA